MALAQVTKATDPVTIGISNPPTEESIKFINPINAPETIVIPPKTIDTVLVASCPAFKFLILLCSLNNSG